ncbi:hypothetical protein MXB_4867 [Myxobolus squamalis]|nr:hypothetical protein MXB_4867 [Myxobolus squamalis]
MFIANSLILSISIVISVYSFLTDPIKIPTSPIYFYYCIVYSASGMLSQYANFQIVLNFGSLVGSIASTIKKCIGIALSVIIFHHSFNFSQYIGMFLVLSASSYIIFVDSE